MTLYRGDCLEVMRTMPDCSVDSVVTDPPYGLSFMGKRWDYDVPSADIWRECLRVLKPGGHLLAFAGTRTQHRMAVNIENAGFEIRDMIAWVYGSGFPKSMDISKAIDKAAGAEREVVGVKRLGGNAAQTTAEKGGTYASNTNSVGVKAIDAPITATATPKAQQWQGWGTALKPALEPITVARKPFKGTVAQNVLEHGTGGINIDGCRVGSTVETWPASRSYHSGRGPKPRGAHGTGDGETISTKEAPPGRWPANLIHDGSEEVTQLFPDAGGGFGKRGAARQMDGWGMGGNNETVGYGDSGSAARFFYCAKASKADREDGNVHPTVKPVELMAYLCRLVTPPGGIVLDPFMGSGSTIKAALSEGFCAIGIERDPSYYAIAERRLNSAQLGLPMELEP